MKNLAAAIALLSFILMPSTGYAAADQWSYEPDSLTTSIPAAAGARPIYYHVDDTTDSAWVGLSPGRTYTICLDPDTTATTAGATVQIYRAISAPTANGSAVLLGATLTGTWPYDCIEGVPGGVQIQVHVVANDGSDAAVVSVRGED